MAMAESDLQTAEEPVIEAVRAGDRYAFTEFVRRNDRWVRSVIYGVLGRREQVDDVAQQAWTCVWQRVGELKDDRRWRSWLYRLAKNAAIDAGREVTRRRGLVSGAAEETRPRAAESPSEGMVDREQGEVVLDAVRGLPAIYREPFVLRHVNGWSYRQIGELMGLPVDTVETRLVRARRQLRDALKDKIH